MKRLFIIFCILFMFSYQTEAQTSVTICAGSTIALTSATSGGTWNSSNTLVATASSSTGIVTGVSPGTATITYTGASTIAITLVTVNPVPVLSSPLTPPAICDSALFDYFPSSATVGGSFNWVRAAVTGISNPANSGSGDILEVLDNTTTTPIVVVYTYTLLASGCSNTQNVIVTVNPKPILSSPLTLPAICDSTVLVYSPASASAGTTFSWSEPYVPSIYSPAVSGTGNINEALINATYVIVPVVFYYTLSANGCTNSQSITVTVYPTPMLTSTVMPPAICDSTIFNYVPTSYTPGAAFSWDRPAITGISPGTSFGTGNISELLYNTTASSIIVSYEYRLAVGSCPNLGFQTVEVTVEHCTSNGVSIISGTEKGILIYPNPARGSFTLELPSNANQTTITISDVLGEMIETRTVEASADTKQLFNLDKLRAGTYFIKANIDGQSYREKIVVY